MTETDKKAILNSLAEELPKARNTGQLNQIKSQYLGKKSQFAIEMAKLSQLAKQDRAKQGKILNDLRSEIESVIEQARLRLLGTSAEATIDLSVPDTRYRYGHMHPSSHILEQVYQIFSHLGFAIVDGPEIETDWYNFEVLGIPPDHPARDMQDTFYLTEEVDDRPLIPRTQTSAMQVRFLESNQPPVKIIVPGKVFRNENEDRTHAWIFNQIEGLVVGEGVSLADLRGTLELFVKEVLGQDSKIRFRPSFFPYTEPSVEVDAWYNGEWLEMGGAGMVHPQVLINSGVDNQKYSGFAFGFGVERLAQVKYKASDLRVNWRPNLKFLEEF